MSQDHEISICLGSSCFSRNNKTTVNIIKSYIDNHQLNASIFFHGDLCTGNCQKGPILRIDNQLYEYITPHNINEILDAYFKPSNR